MQPAFCLGNGKSRLDIDLNQLKEKGPIYGCNALYREFTPTCLIATDPGIAKAIQESGYAEQNRFHTRRPIAGLGARTLHKDYKGFSSGPNAVSQSLIDGYQTIYMLGFDLGTTDGIFNNVYADTKFYKSIADPPTFAGNWIRQIRQLTEDFSQCQFFRVQGPESAHVTGFAEIHNLRCISIEQFRQQVNI
jgi:hypothetical protein